MGALGGEVPSYERGSPVDLLQQLGFGQAELYELAHPLQPRGDLLLLQKTIQ